MKKICLIVLILCMCVSALTGCSDGGEKNAYQKFIENVKNSNDVKEWLPEKNENYQEGSIGNGYRLSGEMQCYKRGTTDSFSVFLRESVSKAPEGDTPAHCYFFQYTLTYSAKENTLTAYPTVYQISTGASEDAKGKITWTDGCYYQSSLTLSFDMSKYFENGKLTLEDATIVKDIDASAVERDQKIGGKTYTERHPEWGSEMKANFIAAINDALALVDAYIANK